MNPLIRQTKIRNCARRAIEEFFDLRDYQQVETPILVTCPGSEIHLRYFETNWQDYNNENFVKFLRSSPELHMKQLVASGLHRIYQLGPCFRNVGEYSQWHHPEFTMLEFYRSDITLEEMMQETCELIEYVSKNLKSSFPDIFGHYEFHSPQKISVFEAFKDWLGIELLDEDTSLVKKAIEKGFLSVRKDDDFETCFFKLLIDGIEPKLRSFKAAILYDYPASQAALSRVVENKAQRFELYINGIETCNAFDELWDLEENQKRFQSSNLKRIAQGYESPELDRYFFESIDRKLAPCCGNALGFERLLALLAGEPNIGKFTIFKNQWRNPN